MVALTSTASSVLRTCARHQLPALRAASVAGQRRNRASAVERSAGEYDRTPSFDSPFRNPDVSPSTKIPSFKNYMSKKGETSNKTFQYFMVGSMGLLAAAGAKATVQGRSIYQQSELSMMENDRLLSGSAANVGFVRFPGQHGRICRCAGASKGRDRTKCYSRGQECVSEYDLWMEESLDNNTRSSSNGEGSLFSSATALRMRLRKPRTLNGNRYEILSQTRTVFRNQSGL